VNAPRANIVSRFLREQGFSRSTSRATRVKGLPTISAGYEVYSQDGKTVVTYTLGTGNPFMKPERRLELVSSVVYAMEKALSTRYTVIMFEPAEGVAFRLTLPGDTA
jgi:hypothetical protein